MIYKLMYPVKSPAQKQIRIYALTTLDFVHRLIPPEKALVRANRSPTTGPTVYDTIIDYYRKLAAVRTGFPDMTYTTTTMKVPKHVYVNLRIFRNACYTCTICGLKASFFAIEDAAVPRPEVIEAKKTFRLYGIKNGKAVLFNKDHIIPRKEGGVGKSANLVCSCMSCNTAKADSTSSDMQRFIEQKKIELRTLRATQEPKETEELERLVELFSSSSQKGSETFDAIEPLLYGEVVQPQVAF
jgi:hypothetical protein